MTMGAPANLDTIYAPIHADLSALGEFLDREFASPDPFIHEILEHIAQFRGKQIRPALLFLCTRLAGGEVTDDVIKIGAVLELVHTATLVHDDLLDSATMRRRVETVHERWGDDRPAILIGDFIYSRAFELSTQVDGMAAVLSRATNTICEGELLQNGCRRQPDISEETYLEIIYKKTAVLHATACELGGVFAGLTPDQSRELGAIGRQLGMAFQIIDDCLDYAGEESVVGKSLGTDLEQGKLTLPLLYLRAELDANGPAGAEWFRSVIVGNADEATQRALHDRVIESGVLERSLERATGFVEDAKSTLRSFPAQGEGFSDAAKESLELAANYVLQRQR